MKLEPEMKCRFLPHENFPVSIDSENSDWILKLTFNDSRGNSQNLLMGKGFSSFKSGSCGFCEFQNGRSRRKEFVHGILGVLEEKFLIVLMYFDFGLSEEISVFHLYNIKRYEADLSDKRISVSLLLWQNLY